MQADIAKELIGYISDNALAVNNSIGMISTLMNVIRSDVRQKSIAKEISSALTEGINNARVTDSVELFSKTMARLKLDREASTAGGGIAGVMGAFVGLSNAKDRDTIKGVDVRGSDVIAYAKLINNLNDDFKSGKINANDYDKAITNIGKRYKDLGDLLKSPADQIERIKDAARNLVSKGFASINKYFSDITEQAKELDKKAKELEAPIGQVLNAIGKFKSVADIFSLSVKAIKVGFSELGRDFNEINKAGSSVSKAGIIARGAEIAQSVINTETGKAIENKIKNDPLFKNNNIKDLRDISLLLGDIKEFDIDGIQNAFTRINSALIKGQINEAQYAKLFNVALDTFEGLEGGINGASSRIYAIW